MPAQTERVERLRDESPPGNIPYASKSRIGKYITCPEKFYFSYIKGYKAEETGAMRRGTNIHETIEEYYENVTQHVNSTRAFPDDLVQFLPNVDRWSDYLEPYITNFLVFEQRRMEVCREQVARTHAQMDDDQLHSTPEEEAASLWLPAEIEAEEWLEDPLGYGDKAIPWMGYADAIYPAAAFPEVKQNSGVVIVDFKTGKTPDEKYRDDGIYLEGEYYGMLFKSEYDVAAVAGYYPKNDDLIISPLKQSRRDKIRGVVEDFQRFNEETPDHLETDEQPLCYYGEGEDQKCPYYNMCESTWGEPLKHADRTRELHEQGCSKAEIADDLGCDYGAVNYAYYKLGL